MLHASTILLHSSSRFFTKASLKLLLARMTIIGLRLLSSDLSTPFIYDRELLYILTHRERQKHISKDRTDICWMLHITMDMAYLYVITTKLHVIIS